MDVSATDVSAADGPGGRPVRDVDGWRRELLDLVRAASGGLLFGIPLLYTMEMWWTAEHTTPEQSLAVLALIFVPVLILNRTSGFRSTTDVRLADAVKDTVEAVAALGVVIVTAVLILLREIRADTPLDLAIAKIVYESVPFCLGIGVATHFLRQGRTEGDGDGTSVDGTSVAQSSAARATDGGLNATVADLGAGLFGAFFVAFNVAPTDEIPMIAAQLSAVWLVAFVGVSLIVSYGIVFVAGFTDQAGRRSQEGPFQHPVTETVVAYLIALASAGAMLAVFQRIDGPWQETLSHVIVLGLPAAIGGAAGRLAT